MKKFISVFILVVLMFGVVGAGGCFGNKNRGNDNMVDFSKMTYVALGDSITYAMDGTNGGQHMDEPYCKLVGDILGFEHVENYGISGSTVSHAENFSYRPYCERYVDMIGDADVVSVMGGANDIANNCALGEYGDITTNTFYGALDVLAKGLKQKYPNAFIFFMTPLKIKFIDDSYDANYHLVADEYRFAIKQVCAKYDIPVLDTYALCDFAIEYKAEDYEGDGVHPSQEFHKNTIAPVVAQFISNHYKTK